MKEILTRSLGQIVKDNYRTAAVLEKYNLDFCCRGKRSLQEACKQQGLSAETIAIQISEVSKTGSIGFIHDYDALLLGQLIEVIIDMHHTYVKKELPSIMTYLQRVVAKHGQKYPEMVKVFELFVTLKEEMELHMQKEELILFPRIRHLEDEILAGQSGNKLHKVYLQSPILVMEQEHDQAGSLVLEIRKVTGSYEVPADACSTYRLLLASLQAFEMDLHHHVHLENNILFPKALKLFDQSPGNN